MNEIFRNRHRKIRGTFALMKNMAMSAAILDGRKSFEKRQIGQWRRVKQAGNWAVHSSTKKYKNNNNNRINNNRKMIIHIDSGFEGVVIYC
jgi:hypothetical protein